jgi:hypothetical protein
MKERTTQMPESEKTLTERAETLDETPMSDHALIAGLAALQAIPTIGGFAATFISEYVPRKKQARVGEFVKDLARQLDAERERIDHEFVRSDEFEGMFEDVLDRVQQRKNEEKFEYWAALLGGMATNMRPPRADRDRMIDTLDALRPSHLQLLHTIATTTKGRADLYMGGVSDTLQWKFPDTPLEDLRRDWDDLARADVVQSYPSAMMTAEGAGNLSVRLTPYGRKFLAMLDVRKLPDNGS